MEGDERGKDIHHPVRPVVIDNRAPNPALRLQAVLPLEPDAEDVALIHCRAWTRAGLADGLAGVTWGARAWTEPGQKRKETWAELAQQH